MLDKVGEELLRKIAKTDFWKWFVKKYLSSFTLRNFGYPKFPMDEFFKIVDTLDKNKVYCFVCSDYESLGSKVIRSITDSKFTHAGFVLPGSDRNTRCVHIRSTGVKKDHMLSILREVDYIAIVDPDVSDYCAVREKVDYFLMNSSSFSYDFEERLDNDPYKIYCSEMVYRALKSVCKSPNFKPQSVLGRDVFLPDNIMSIGRIVYTNHPDLKPKA